MFDSFSFSQLFYDWRFQDDGTTPNTEFELNQADVKGSSILVARQNFGSGSSREHAVWALDDYGFRAVIAPSFADIFFNNCFKNGLLPVILKKEEIEEIKTYIGSLSLIEINLENQLVKCADKSYEFEIDPSISML